MRARSYIPFAVWMAALVGGLWLAFWASAAHKAHMSRTFEVSYGLLLARWLGQVVVGMAFASLPLIGSGKAKLMPGRWDRAFLFLGLVLLVFLLLPRPEIKWGLPLFFILKGGWRNLLTLLLVTNWFWYLLGSVIVLALFEAK